MTTTITPRIQYTAAASQTVFTFAWEFYDTSEIVVYYTPIATGVQALLATSAYTVTAPSAVGGSITLLASASAGDIVTILRVMALTSIATFYDSAPYTAQMLNESYNNIIYMVQGIAASQEILQPSYLPGTPVITGVDDILPQLAANQIWAKNSANTAIIAIDIPGGTTSPGTVTNIATGQGLSGGPITTTGTISVTNGGITPLMMQTQTPGRLGGYTSTGLYAPIIVGSGLAINTSTNTLTATGGGSGTVTSVATGVGLTGGPITGAGTIAVAAGTANTLSGYNNSGVFSGVTVSTGLSLSGGVLTNTASGGGNYVKISSQTASNSAAITFTGLTTAYNQYEVKIINMQPVNSVNFVMQVSTNGGSTWVTTSTYVCTENWIYSDANHPRSFTGTALSILGIAGSMMNTSFCNSLITLNGCGSTGFSAFYHTTYFDSSSAPGTQAMVDGSISMYASNINAVRFLMGTGNITSGLFILYGLN